MICPYCGAETSFSSTRRSAMGARLIVILCSFCQKILGVVNDPGN